MQHLDNLRLQIPLFRLAAEPDDPLDPRVASAEADDGEQGVEHVHYLLYTADDKVPSPLPADMLQYVRTASLLQDKASNLESAVEGASMRAWELFGYDRGDWVPATPVSRLLALSPAASLHPSTNLRADARTCLLARLTAVPPTPTPAGPKEDLRHLPHLAARGRIPAVWPHRVLLLLRQARAKVPHVPRGFP